MTFPSLQIEDGKLSIQGPAAFDTIKLIGDSTLFVGQNMAEDKSLD